LHFRDGSQAIGITSAFDDSEQRQMHPLSGAGPMRTRPFLGLIALAVCGPLACGGGGGSSTLTTPTTPTTPLTPATPNDVLVENNSFNPATLTVTAGTTVKWTWATCSGGSDPYGGGTGQTCVSHSVTWDAGGTASPTQEQGTYQRLFDTPGTYTYHCSIHGAAMSGKVVVQ
jgi:plastocyanin